MYVLHGQYVAGEFTQPLSGFQDGFRADEVRDSETAEGHRDVVVAHVSKGQQLTAIDLDFGSRTTYSARRTEKEREEKIGPFLKLCLVRMHAFAL